MNSFENHELVCAIYEVLRDHKVLTHDGHLNTLTTDQQLFLRAIDSCITEELENSDFFHSGHTVSVEAKKEDSK